MTQDIYDKAKSIQEDLAELGKMLNSIPFPDNDSTSTLYVTSPRLKSWLKCCIASKIEKVQIEFKNLG